jgi:predicted neuraminidase
MPDTTPATGGFGIADQPGYVKGELIYPLDNKPTPECHASTIEATADHLVAAWFGGTEEKDPDVGIWVSLYENDTWSPAIEVANGVVSSTERYPTWNPVLYQPEEGPLMLFYKMGPSPDTWWGMQITSEDQGRTWAAPERLPDGILGPIKNKPVHLSDGSILSPSSTEHDGWRVHLERSVDEGKSWQFIGPLDEEEGFEAIQPTVLIHGPEQLQILCRSRAGVVAQSWSTDNGLTWTPLAATNLPNPNSGIDGVTLNDGRHLLVYNHVGKEEGKWGGPRSPLNVAVSDDGENWQQVLVLEDQPGEYSYPAVIQAPDGMVHITYTYQRLSIKHVIVDPAQWTTDGS